MLGLPRLPIVHKQGNSGLAKLALMRIHAEGGTESIVNQCQLLDLALYGIVK